MPGKGGVALQKGSTCWPLPKAISKWTNGGGGLPSGEGGMMSRKRAVRPLKNGGGAQGPHGTTKWDGVLSGSARSDRTSGGGESSCRGGVEMEP